MGKDLWGNLPEIGDVRTPYIILSEQANVITQKTEALLEGKVHISNKSPGNFQAQLLISAPSLAGFYVQILSITHGVELYPVKIQHGLTSETFNPKTEEEYYLSLSTIFQSAKVQSVIKSLLIQIKAIATQKLKFEEL